jgi:hypothetical protein
MSRQHWSLKRVVVVSLSVVVWLGAGLGVPTCTWALTGPCTASRRRDPAKARCRQRTARSAACQGPCIWSRTARSTGWGVASSRPCSTRPAVLPAGPRIHAGRPEPGPGPKDYAYSDPYLIDPAGNVQAQLTHNTNVDRRAPSLGLLSAIVVRWRALLQLRPEGQVQLLRRGLGSLVDADDGRHRSGPAVDPT